MLLIRPPAAAAATSQQIQICKRGLNDCAMACVAVCHIPRVVVAVGGQHLPPYSIKIILNAEVHNIETPRSKKRLPLNAAAFLSPKKVNLSNAQKWCFPASRQPLQRFRGAAPLFCKG